MIQPPGNVPNDDQDNTLPIQGKSVQPISEQSKNNPSPFSQAAEFRKFVNRINQPEDPCVETKKLLSDADPAVASIKAMKEALKQQGSSLEFYCYQKDGKEFISIKIPSEYGLDGIDNPNGTNDFQELNESTIKLFEFLGSLPIIGIIMDDSGNERQLKIFDNINSLRHFLFVNPKRGENESPKLKDTIQDHNILGFMTFTEFEKLNQIRVEVKKRTELPEIAQRVGSENDNFITITPNIVNGEEDSLSKWLLEGTMTWNLSRGEAFSPNFRAMYKIAQEAGNPILHFQG